MATCNKSAYLCDPFPVFQWSHLNSCSLSLSPISKKYLQPSGLTLLVYLHLYSQCVRGRPRFRFSAARRRFNVADMDWLWFPPQPVEVWSRVSRVSVRRAPCFHRQLSEVTRSGCVCAAEPTRALDRTDFKHGSGPRLLVLVRLVIKVMAERLLVAVFCLTITLSHAGKGKLDTEALSNFLNLPVNVCQKRKRWMLDLLTHFDFRAVRAEWINHRMHCKGLINLFSIQQVTKPDDNDEVSFIIR